MLNDRSSIDFKISCFNSDKLSLTLNKCELSKLEDVFSLTSTMDGREDLLAKIILIKKIFYNLFDFSFLDLKFVMILNPYLYLF